ncbi:RNA-binding protein 48 [Copidosoma floridanum]|uniref:RNA-binding protein 48 n=1 Tax=Copidosoma floridanum TaxID=29053 RepID=UPI0006C9B447|nr:RNA-binding protein 48 [Copidosoma floridanum]
MSGNLESTSVAMPEHHIQEELCHTRPTYRKGRKETAVKVYTINDESVHLIVCGTPSLDLFRQLKGKFLPYGEIKQFVKLPDYPSEQFTETFHVHYQRIQSARVAKRFLDGHNFYGGLLHVFYAPEYETLAETRQKLAQRLKDVTVRIKRHKEDPTNPEIETFEPEPNTQRKKKRPALPQVKR